MDIPASARRPSIGLPPIFIHDPSSADRSRMSSRSSSYSSRFSPSIASNPMSIPNSREPGPPPPLPPPKFVDVGPLNGRSGDPDLAWHISNSREDSTWVRQSSSVNPGSSLYGSIPHRGKSLVEHERPEFSKRGKSTPTIKTIPGLDFARDIYPRLDEGYGSLSGTSIGSNQSKLEDTTKERTGFKSAVHEKFQSNAQAYDKSVLQKLGSGRTGDNATQSAGYPRSPFSSSLNDISPTSRIAQEHSQLAQKALSLPVSSTRLSSVESPLTRWADGGFSDNSPQTHVVNGSGPYDYRSPSERDETERSPSQYSRRYISGASNSEDNASVVSQSHSGSYEQNGIADHESDFTMEGTTRLRRLQIDDKMHRGEGYSPQSAVGHKRRASSPLQEDSPPPLHTVSSSSDLYRRRDSSSRPSPAPRYHSSNGSMSSTTSGPPNGSYTSTLAASSITSISSYDRLSPVGLSPGAVSPMSIDGSDSPLARTLSLDPSPRGLHSRPVHHRTTSETRPAMASRKTAEVLIPRKSSSLKLQGGFSCECCPKKPKSFETEEELAAHEAEKQYECAYCKNRFKNKNEAERHQNSLHLRRHSWSCAALTRYASAFHPSQTRPTEADTCGYCGDEFLRTGPRCSATEQDWESRIQHLIDIHKFGECNHTKKFFRADHFRQHLKHSHAGTSGKWTNMLENACMKDEPMPEPRDRSSGANSVNSSGPGRPARITEEDELI